MTVKETLYPFNAAVVDIFDEREVASLAQIFATPLMAKFCKYQIDYIQNAAVELDPIMMKPEDYYDTMVHLKGLGRLWDGLMEFHRTSIQALKAEAARSNQQ